MCLFFLLPKIYQLPEYCMMFARKIHFLPSLGGARALPVPLSYAYLLLHGPVLRIRRRLYISLYRPTTRYKLKANARQIQLYWLDCEQYRDTMTDRQPPCTTIRKSSRELTDGQLLRSLVPRDFLATILAQRWAAKSVLCRVHCRDLKPFITEPVSPGKLGNTMTDT